MPDTGQELPRLQAKVHIEKGEEKGLAELLVRRNICCWVREENVLTFRGQKVLNGMFGVPKSKVLANHQTALRCIMNLIPSNSLLRTIPGLIHRLPAVTQWMHIHLGPDESLSICQNDMVSAFYLFALPQAWSEMLSFGLSFTGKQLGFEPAEECNRFYLACKVLPMGWSSAVGIMQQIAESVLLQGGIPGEQQLVRGRPMPAWMIETRREAEAEGKVWWQVYLDNYASGEKIGQTEGAHGGQLQAKVEALWEAVGIISSSSKVVTEQRSATELGAFIGGKGQWIGAGPDRMLKLEKSTLWVLSKRQISRKLLQIIMGRWVFAMQFRRPFMAHFEEVWKAWEEKQADVLMVKN